MFVGVTSLNWNSTGPTPTRTRGSSRGRARVADKSADKSDTRAFALFLVMVSVREAIV